MTKKPKKPDRTPRTVALVGLMGVGKTTVGRRLARQLDIGFVDADTEIETAAGMSVSEIFERFGEAYFRDGERRVLARLLESEPKVIATGGGAFMDEQTRTALLEHALVIWLDADIDTLVERTARRSHRPLLKGKNAGSVLRRLAEERNPTYAQAHIHIASSPAPPSTTVDEILRRLEALESA